ncbi:acyl carrier protein [Jatrophihabitans sp.]|uniref:acyl carrier protein n=1 Tax=Jatrophihabitans sp. TaxID=1932789 RepID=UPI002D007DB2|nr:acyl carrier protein [Jatrophihabitans sp.]
MYELLVGILVEELELNAGDVRPDSSCEDVGLDSLAMVELSMILQKRHHLQISDDELLKTKRVSEIVRIMEARAGS